jgi:hypothetical protein
VCNNLEMSHGLNISPFPCISYPKIFQDPAILAENVYNMEEIGVMLSMPGSLKVLVDKGPRTETVFRCVHPLLRHCVLVLALCLIRRPTLSNGVACASY